MRVAKKYFPMLMNRRRHLDAVKRERVLSASSSVLMNSGIKSAVASNIEESRSRER